MIGSLKGIVQGLYEDRALLEVGGVGYLVFMGNRNLARAKKGEALFLFIETIVREDSIRLFGFHSDLERAWFVRLQEVTGVGAKVALAILDILSPNQIIQAVEIGDKVSVSRASGVGPKLAQRIVTELKGRNPPSGLMGGFETAAEYAPSPDIAPLPAEDMGLRNEAVSALQNLGFIGTDAMSAVAIAIANFDGTPSLGELVKAALKELKR
jgi:holliday junction DNA helicase RuvA